MTCTTSLPEEVLDAFIEHVLARYGTPSELRSDRGSNLIEKLSQQFYDLCGIKLVTSTSHHHQGLPGAVERFNQTLLGITRASSGGKQVTPLNGRRCSLSFYSPYGCLKIE